MASIRLVEVKEEILADNDKVAGEIRKQLRSRQVFMLNLMASPGGGKTSLIIETLRGLKRSMRAGVIEADIDSMVDAEKVAQEGIPAVQLRTGGACHVEAIALVRPGDAPEIPATTQEMLGKILTEKGKLQKFTKLMKS